MRKVDNLPAPQHHARSRRLLDSGASMFLTDMPGDVTASMGRELESGR